jgi:ribosomal protein S1
VLSTDPKAKRIALSMKALDAAPARPKPAVKKPSLDRQVAALSNRFRVK